MKKQIVGFVLGTFFGGVVIFTIGADNQRPVAWDYKVVAGHVSSYPNNPSLQELLNQASTNGWQVAAAVNDGDLPVVILKRAK